MTPPRKGAPLKPAIAKVGDQTARVGGEAAGSLVGSDPVFQVLYALRAYQQQVLAQLVTMGGQLTEPVLANPANPWWELGMETFFIIRLVIGNAPFSDRVIDNLLAMPWPQSTKPNAIPVERFVRWLALDDTSLKNRLAAWPGSAPELLAAIDQFVPLRETLAQAWNAQRGVTEVQEPSPPARVCGDYVGGDKVGGDKVAGSKIINYGASQAEIEEQLGRLQVNRETLNIYLGQLARQGAAHVAPGVPNGIREARGNIARIKDTLRSWGVEVEDYPDDIAPRTY